MTSTSSSPSNQGSAQQQLGRPTLTMVDAVAESLAVGPVFSVAFVAVVLAGVSGAHAPLAMLGGTVGMIALCLIITQYARRYAGAAGIYEYVRHVAPLTIGRLAAGMYFIGTTLLAGAASYLVFGLIGTAWLALWGVDVPWWLVALVGAGLTLAINHVGVRTTTRVQLVLAVLSIIPVVFLAGAILVQGGDAGNTLEPFNVFSVAPSQLFGGIFFAITMFTGFEAAGALGEETVNPHQAIPRALIATVLISAVFYVLVMYACAIGFGVDHADVWSSDPASLGTLATRYVGGWLAPIIDLAVLIDILALASAFTAAAARGWFALAREGLLPVALAYTSRRYATPLGGNVLVFCVGVAAVGLAVVSGVDTLEATVIVVTAGSLLIDLIYISLAVLAVRFIIGEPGPWWRWGVLFIAVSTPVLALYGMLVPFPVWPNNVGIGLGIGGGLLALLWSLAIRQTEPQPYLGTVPESERT